MRKGVFISLGLHGLVTLIAFVSVSFRQVTYMPRETYRVRIVSAAMAEPVSQKAPAPAPTAPPKPEPKEEVKEEPKPDVLVQPVEKAKPKPKPKPANEENSVPRSQITKSDAAATGDSVAAGASSEAAAGGISFDGGDFPYDAFIARMRNKIAAVWQVPAGSEGVERFAVVYFRVHRDGDITHVSVEQASGVFLFDQSCQRAVIQAAPFPPLPRDYDNEYVGVHFSFKYVPSQSE